MQLIVFTDLDGTLLDAETYSFEPALPAVEMLKEMGIPLIFCSSKTRAEIEEVQKRLGNIHPFISENGGAVFVPKRYFGFAFPHSAARDGYYIVELGARYAELRTILKRIAHEKGAEIRGFGDMAPDEIAGLTGLSLEQAHLAKRREYDEPFVIESGDEAEVTAGIRQKGYQVTRGRFLHITGRSDKGRAVTLLKGLYRKKYDDIRTLALGDGQNDVPMLEKVDIPILVKKLNNMHEPGINIHRLRRADGIGPKGWNKAVIEIVSSLSSK